MNISINNRSVRTLAAASALGLAFVAGSVHGHSADATPSRPAAAAVVAEAPAREHVYYVVDSREAALEVERREYMSSLERMESGVVAPERVVHIIDNSEAGHMTEMERVLVATGGR